MKITLARTVRPGLTESGSKDVLSVDGKTVNKRNYIRRECTVFCPSINYGEPFRASFRKPFGKEDNGEPMDNRLPPGSKFTATMTAYESRGLAVENCAFDFDSIEIIK